MSFARTLTRIGTYAFLGCVLSASFTSQVSAGYGSDPDASPMQILIVLTIIAAIYFCPAIVAFYRRHPNRYLIAVLNTVFGGTVLGWLLSLIWAFRAVHMPDEGSAGGQSGLNLFVNDPKTVIVADPRGIAELERLAKLHEMGAINDAEHYRLKSKVIGRD